jgi:hypothetical protein
MFGLFKYVSDAITGRSRIILQARNDAETQARFDDVVEAALPLVRALRRLSNNSLHRFRFEAQQELGFLRIGTNIKILTPDDRFVVGLSVGPMKDKDGNTRPHILLHKPEGDTVYDPANYADMQQIFFEMKSLIGHTNRMNIWGPVVEPSFPSGMHIPGSELLPRATL